MITVDTTVKEIKNDRVLKKIAHYLIYNTAGDGTEHLSDESRTLRDIQDKTPTWSAKDMAYGLNCIIENGGDGKELLFDVYGEAEIAKCPEKEHVKLIYFPPRGERNRQKRFVILAAGGGYGAVCSLGEAFPVAARLSEMGMPVFCLNYRVAGKEPLFPKPMEDLSAAYRFLKDHEVQFDIDARHYAVGGFSAGGHLAACWGVKGLGYAKYGYPAAEILMLDYPLISVWRTIHPLPAQLQQIMLAGYFGTGYSEEICRPYNIDEMADQDYPPVFMIQAEDDDVVPIWNTGEFADRLEELGVSSRYEHPKTGGHGFGLGTETEAEGWTDRAVAFWDELTKEKMDEAI